MLSQLLKIEIDNWGQKLRDTNSLLQKARIGKLSEQAVASYLKSLGYLFVASNVYLRRAADEAAHQQMNALSSYFAAKAVDESGHDKWAEDDLKNFATESKILHTARALAQLQEDLIKIHPVSYLVYTIWAEYLTVVMGDEWLDALANCGFDRTKLTAVSKHVEADRDHAAHGFKEIDHFWTGVPTESDLLNQLYFCQEAFENFCQEICEI